MGVACSYLVVASAGDTCSSLSANWGITEANFTTLNTGVNCPALITGNSYCVIGTGPTTTPSTTSLTSIIPITSHPATTTSSKTTLVTVTVSTTSASPFQPAQPGLAANCNKFYYVQPGDGCDTIEAKYSLTFAQFYAWNPAVGPQCLSMWTNTYVCVGVPGSTTGLPPPPPTPTQTGPQPQMPGVVSYCKKYYLVQPGDTCATIDAKEGTSLLQIVVWNPYINIPQCTNLWLGYYICVGA